MTIEYLAFTQPAIIENLAGLVDLLCDVVDNGASVNFIAPMSSEIAEQYWLGVAEKIQSNGLMMVVAVENQQVIGTVQVALAPQPNAPHRAEIQKLLVHSTQRRRGIATQLMQVAEASALAAGRWLVYLDTQWGSDAVHFYEKMGYIHAGGIEQFALDNTGKDFVANVIYYKRLQ